MVGKDHCNFHHTEELTPLMTKELPQSKEQKTTSPRANWSTAANKPFMPELKRTLKL